MTGLNNTGILEEAITGVIRSPFEKYTALALLRSVAATISGILRSSKLFAVRFDSRSFATPEISSRPSRGRVGLI